MQAPKRVKPNKLPKNLPKNSQTLKNSKTLLAQIKNSLSELARVTKNQCKT
jgi:hypothetical protein